MSISIAMATYNGGRYLQAQLESIKSQIRRPDELIICDDCSSDSTLEIANEFSKVAPFEVRIVQNPTRLGSTKNFEKAILLCTSEIIALSDQDDIWFPEKLECQCAMFEQNPSLGGVFSDAKLIDQHSHPTGGTLWQVNSFTRSAQSQLHLGNMFSDGIVKKKALGCTLMFRSNLVDKITPIPEHWEHDGWIAWIIAIYSKIDIIPATLICYRLHSSQQYGVAPLPISAYLKDKTDSYRRDIRQLNDLRERIKSQNSQKGQEFLPNIENIIAYLGTRLNLPQNRLERIRIVKQNMANYRRFSSGWLSAFRDIVR